MILIDANIFFYAAGDDEQHKGPSVEFLRAVAEDALDAAVDARILEEILQRYRRLEMPAEGRRICTLVQRSVPTVLESVAHNGRRGPLPVPLGYKIARPEGRG